jgi:hypothetical protein
MGQIEALEDWAEASTCLNEAFSRAQGAPVVLSTVVAGRNDRHKSIYNDNMLDCGTGGGVAAATFRGVFRAPAIATPLRRCAGAKPCW